MKTLIEIVDADNKRRKRKLYHFALAMVAVVFLIAHLSQAWAYDKPYTYDHDTNALLFKNGYMNFPHSWVIVKAIALLRQDGYYAEADLAERYQLPMLEGAMFNDVWGDADLAGASVLDYYCPDRPDQNYGYGCALMAYKNCTSAYQTHPFYGYGNAAEYAQSRYDYARRVYLGNWGSDPHDLMAGWVVDTVGGQDDPMDGKWANGADKINAQTRFGRGQTPASAMRDLLNNYCRYDDVFPQYETEAWSSKIFVPTKQVFDNEPEWLDNHFQDADDIPAYCGYDGNGYAVYANWTTDSGGDEHSSPFIFYVPVNSREHSFFLLGWAMHLVADNTLPVHTVDGSFDAYQVHNDVESYADETLSQNKYYNGRLIKDSLPAVSASDFQALYPWPPPTCAASTPDPVNYYKQRWYADALELNQGEGIAHAYVRNAAEIAHRYWPYIQPAIIGAGCIDTEGDRDWAHMGFFTALELDMAIKATAGLLHEFLSDVGAGDKTSPEISLVALSPDPTTDNTPTFGGTVTDTGSNIKSVEYSIDNGATWIAAEAGDGAFDSLSEGFTFASGPLSDGIHTVSVRATDISNNTTQPGSYASDTFLIDTTPPVITIAQPAASQYSHNSTLIINYEVNDGVGSGVKMVMPTMDGSTTLAGHGLAGGQTVNLLTELALGQHEFTVEASDNVGLSSMKSVTFNIIVTAQGIEDEVRQFVAAQTIIQDGGQSLQSKLTAAAKARATGNCTTAQMIYQSFINEVEAQSGKKIDPIAALILVQDARYLMTNCP